MDITVSNKEQLNVYNRENKKEYTKRDLFKLIYKGSEILYDNDLPESIEFLEVYNDFEIDDINPLPLIQLKNPPTTLKTIQISSESNKLMEPYPINFFPDTITTLIFSGTDNRPFLPDTFKSSSVTSITFSYWYNFPFENNSLPNGIKELLFFKYGKFNQQFQPNQIPASLITLKLPQYYSQPLSKEFIQSLPLLETLFLPDSYNSLEYEFLKSIKNINYFKPARR
ncbi:hypothetical protein ACTA71_008613 [Dictyostelium dimigraforme]